MIPEPIQQLAKMLPPVARGILVGTAGVAYLAKLFCDKEIEYKSQAVKNVYLQKELDFKHQLNTKDFELQQCKYTIQNLTQENEKLVKSKWW
jgi:hypothetical protein